MMENKTVRISADYKAVDVDKATITLARQTIPHMHTVTHKDIYERNMCNEDKDGINLCLSIEGIYDSTKFSTSEVLKDLEEFFKEFAELKTLSIAFNYK